MASNSQDVDVDSVIERLLEGKSSPFSSFHTHFAWVFYLNSH